MRILISTLKFHLKVFCFHDLRIIKRLSYQLIDKVVTLATAPVGPLALARWRLLIVDFLANPNELRVLLHPIT